MEMTYFTLDNTACKGVLYKKTNNVICLDEHRERLLNRPRDAEYTVLEPPAPLLCLPASAVERSAYMMDIVASVGLLLGAFVSLCVVLYALL